MLHLNLKSEGSYRALQECGGCEEEGGDEE